MSGVRPDLVIESRLALRYGPRIAGVDEAGRGPLAGPVVAAAVCFTEDAAPVGIDDSKRVSARRRRELFPEILERADVSVAVASLDTIATHNIRVATLCAMTRALRGLVDPPALALLDGIEVPAHLPFPAVPLRKGDQRSLTVAAASIVAKCIRDAVMARIARRCPDFDFESNFGYGTLRHREKLARLGPSRWHRLGWAGVSRNVP